MQIKTGITLLTGIGIGTIVGMSVSDKTRQQIINKIKSKLIFALTGEEWKPHKASKSPVSYIRYSAEHDPVPKYSKEEIIDAGLLNFESQKEAEDILLQMICRATRYGFVSLHEIADMRKKAIKYTYDRYGWNKEEVEKMSVKIRKVFSVDPVKERLDVGEKEQSFYIDAPCMPHLLDEE